MVELRQKERAFVIVVCFVLRVIIRRRMKKDIWVDEQDKLHIVLRDVRTARYRVIDFVFNPAEKEFIGTDVLDGEGGNYIGTTRK